jgi:hypothetical protein
MAKRFLHPQHADWRKPAWMLGCTAHTRRAAAHSSREREVQARGVSMRDARGEPA